MQHLLVVGVGHERFWSLCFLLLWRHKSARRRLLKDRCRTPKRGGEIEFLDNIDLFELKLVGGGRLALLLELCWARNQFLWRKNQLVVPKVLQLELVTHALTLLLQHVFLLG